MRNLSLEIQYRIKFQFQHKIKVLNTVALGSKSTFICVTHSVACIHRRKVFIDPIVFSQKHPIMVKRSCDSKGEAKRKLTSWFEASDRKLYNSTNNTSTHLANSTALFQPISIGAAVYYFCIHVPTCPTDIIHYDKSLCLRIFQHIDVPIN